MVIHGSSPSTEYKQNKTFPRVMKMCSESVHVVQLSWVVLKAVLSNGIGPYLVCTKNTINRYFLHDIAKKEASN